MSPRFSLYAAWVWRYKELRKTDFWNNKLSWNFEANELLGITYDPTVGVLSRKYNEEIGATQCAHIFWYAFYKHGYDIDSNGGAVVTPKDIANSEYFEVVQVSGFNPQTLWGNWLC